MWHAVELLFERPGQTKATGTRESCENAVPKPSVSRHVGFRVYVLL